MNRCKISIGVLLALVLLCICSLLVLRWQCHTFAGRVDAVTEAVEEGNIREALEAYDGLYTQWEQFHDVAGLFVSGTKLDPMYEILTGLRPLIVQQHPEVTAELERLRGLTEGILAEEMPSVWHIL